MRGSVTRLNTRIGCGFILGEDGLEAYFDLSSLETIDIQALSIGKAVEYEEHFRNERRAARVRVMPNPWGKSAVGGEK
jgi:cold shock CspA family protein